uniref:Venom redulysin 1 n=1 Tax=Ectomocoris sp. TaxID=3104572 RepID=A0AB38ZE42_9HEMI
MSKLWLLLLLVGAIQYARAYPALEEEEEEDVFELSSFEYDLDENLSDEGNVVSAWFRDKWQSMKNKFKKVGKKLKDAFKKGKEVLKKFGISIDGPDCKQNKCKSCMSFPKEKKKFCIEIVFNPTGCTVTLTKEKDKEEPVIVTGPHTITVSDKKLNCKSLGKFLGDCCLKNVEGKMTTQDGKPFANYCVGLVLKNFNIGCKICVGYEADKFKMKFKPKVFAGDEDNNEIMVAGEKEDEGKVMDAVPE